MARHAIRQTEFVSFSNRRTFIAHLQDDAAAKAPVSTAAAAALAVASPDAQLAGSSAAGFAPPAAVLLAD